MSLTLEVLYPNGRVEAVLTYILVGGVPVPWDGAISVVTTGSAINDGVTSTTKATVVNGLGGGHNANPLAVVLTDSNGDFIAGFPVSIANGSDVALGSTTDAAADGDVNGTAIAHLRGIAKKLAASIAVTGPLTDTQLRATAVAISAASLPLPTGASTEATLVTRLSESDFDTKIGSLTETAPTTDTASSGLNGRLQRIAQRITSLITALGSPFQAGGSIGNTSFAATQPTASSLNAQVVGDVAAASADAGNPVKIGGKAATSFPTALTAGNRSNFLTDIYGRLFTRIGKEGPSTAFWNAQHNPSANTKATITKTSAGAGVRNICTSITIALAAQATAPTAVQLTVALIDGASGGSTYLWGPHVISLPAVAGAMSAFVLGQCWKPGTAATAMTLEFSAAGGANTIESVSMDGTTAAE